MAEDRERRGPTDEEWDAFWKSMEQYGAPETLRRQVLAQAADIWADVSPRYAAEEDVQFIVRNGGFGANMTGHVLLAAMTNVVYRQTLNTMLSEDMIDTLAEELQNEIDAPEHAQQIRPLQECRSCGEEVDPRKTHCPECGEEL